MLKRTVLPAGVLTLILAIAVPTQAAKKATYAEREFAEILEEAVEKAGKKGGISGLAWMGTNTWRVNVQGWNERYVDGAGRMVDPGSKKISTLSMPAAFVNLGNGFEFAFNSPAIHSFLYDGIIRQKDIEKVLADFGEKYKDVEVAIERNESDQIAVRATYSYAGGVGEKDIRGRLVMLMEGGRAIIKRVMTAGVEVLEETQKEIQKRELRSLSKVEFLFLTEDELDKVEKEHDEATEGFWSFTYRERGFEMFNYGDRFVASYYQEMPEGLSAAPWIPLST